MYRAHERVGAIRRTRTGSVFEYDEAFHQAHRSQRGGVAVHLPYSRRSFETEGVNLHPYFAGLLPEGLRLAALLRHVKTSPDDLLTLLLASGADTVGDLSVVPEGTQPEEATALADASRLDAVRFSDLLRESLAAVGAEPVLPGVQEKVSAAMISFPLRARRGGKRWILKLNPRDKPRLVENEAFFMRLARRCGLEVANVELVHDRDGAAGLLVERFDRRWNAATRQVERVHQEDACQLVNRYPADKYRLRCRELAEALAVCVSPVIETLRLMEVVAFSYLIGNGDLHAKNVSVVATGPGRGLRLSPAYDLLSTWPYGDRRMALQLEGRLDNLRRKHFVAFGARFGVAEAAVRAMLDRLVERSRGASDGLDEIGLEQGKADELRRVIGKRLRDLG